MLRLSPGTVFTNDVVQPPHFSVDKNKKTNESFPLILPSFSPTRRETPGGKSVGKNVFKRGKKNHTQKNKGALSGTRCLNQIDIHRSVKIDSVTRLRNMLFEVRNLRQPPYASEYGETTTS